MEMIPFSKLTQPAQWSIRWRLTLWQTSVVGLVLTGIGIIAVLMVRSTLLANADRSLTIKAAAVIDQMTGSGRIHGIRTYQSHSPTIEEMVAVAPAAFARATQDVAGTTFYFTLRMRARGAPLAVSANIPPNGYVSATLDDAARSTSGREAHLNFGSASRGSELRILAVPIPQTEAMIEVATPWAPYEGAISQVFYASIALVLVGTLISAISGWFLVDRTLQPIDEIVSEAEKHRGGRLPPEFVASRTLGDDEIGRLAKSLNSMMERVYWAIERQRQFTADASHDLRTPLTIIRVEIQFALARERTAAQYRDVLASLLEEANRLMRLVADLGELARSEAAEEARRFDGTFRIGEICRDVVASREGEAARAGIALLFIDELGVGKSLIAGRSLDMERATANLLDNAIKYNRPGGQVRVFIEAAADSQVEIRVEDTGNGIPQEDVDHIFERFYRGDKARRAGANGSSSGTGLGLAIARAIIDAHGGSVSVESELGRGTTFRVRLPISNGGDLERHGAERDVQTTAA